jgi:hypothetical protein
MFSFASAISRARRTSSSSWASRCRWVRSCSCLARSSRSRSARRSKLVCDVEGLSHPKGGREEERWRREGEAARYRGRSSTIIGRPFGSGDDGAVKLSAKSCGGVVGVGGASTTMIRSLRCCLVGFKEFLLRWCRPSSEWDRDRECRRWDPPEYRCCEDVEDWGGEDGKIGWLNMC